MKVILQQDLKNLGKIGDVVRVKPGFARNFLLPRKIALVATEKKVKEWTHLQKIAEQKKKKHNLLREDLIKRLQDIKVVIKKSAGKNEKLFGSVTSMDIANELEKLKLDIDKRDIILKEPIKTLGEHPIKIKLGEGIETEIIINIEAEDNT